MIEFALPKDLTPIAQNVLAREMAETMVAMGHETADAGRLPVTYAVHDGFGHIPHVHLLRSTSLNDGIDRPAHRWFG